MAKLPGYKPITESPNLPVRAPEPLPLQPLTGVGSAPIAGTGLDVITLGRMMAASGFFADAREEGQACVKILAGQELGIGPVASMTGIYVIKGRITLSANLMAALVKRSQRYDYRVITHTAVICEIQFYENGQLIGQSTFTIEDAQRSGVAGGDNWKKYPRNMLFARALSNGVRWYCPDLTSAAVYSPDELGVVSSDPSDPSDPSDLSDPSDPDLIDTTATVQTL